MGQGLIQLALGLFGIGDDAPPEPSRQARSRGGAEPARPGTHQGRSRRLKAEGGETGDLWSVPEGHPGGEHGYGRSADVPRSDIPAASATPAAAAVPLRSVLAPASFRHPHANREVLLGEARVAYLLQRVRRRSIGFVVDVDGLSVRAPGWVTLSAIDAALQEKSDWILRKLGDSQLRQQRRQDAQVEWKNGAVFPFLGEPLRIVLDAEHRFQGRGAALVAAPHEGLPRELHVALPLTADAAQIRDTVHAWLLKQARAHFIARLDHFAPRLNVRWTKLRLSSAQTRWGSARSDGSICLNWRLLHFRPSVIDYVVAHELSHLRVMDHSPRFWDTVATVVPDYKALRKSLKDEATPSWD